MRSCRPEAKSLPSTDILLITEKFLPGNSGNTENHKPLSPWKPTCDHRFFTELIAKSGSVRVLTTGWGLTCYTLTRHAFPFLSFFCHRSTALYLTVAKCRACGCQGTQPQHWLDPNGHSIIQLKPTLKPVKLYLIRHCKQKAKHKKEESELANLQKSASKIITYCSSF